MTANTDRALLSAFNRAASLSYIACAMFTITDSPRSNIHFRFEESNNDYKCDNWQRSGFFFPEGGVGLVPKLGCLLTLAYYAFSR
jgi:hypothetical protein